MRDHLWSDFVGRAGTIVLGVPVVWIILSHSALTRYLFFQGAHLIVALEWTQLNINATRDHPPRELLLFPLVSLILVSWSNQHGDSQLLSPSTQLALVLFAAAYAIRQAAIHHHPGLDHISQSHPGKTGSTVGNKDKEDNKQTNVPSWGVIFVSPHVVRFMAMGGCLISVPFRAWIQVVSVRFVPTISLLITVWNCDTGALVVGRWHQQRRRRRRMVHARDEDTANTTTNSQSTSWSARTRWLQSISPKKSWQGIIGGIVFGSCTYLSLPWFWDWVFQLGLVSDTDEINWWKQQQQQHHESWSSSIQSTSALRWIERLGWGMLLSMCAILGDLWESSLKRQLAVRESAAHTYLSLPGHGGILDRFDSSLIAVLLWTCFLQRQER